MNFLSDFGRDLRYAVRQARRKPGFAALVVVTLALGIGANATMAGVIDRVLLQPPPNVRDPGGVVRLLHVGRDPLGQVRASPWMNYPTFLDIQRSASAFTDVAAYTVSSLPSGEGSAAVPVNAWLVSSDYFRVLGVQPLLGQFFAASGKRAPGERTSDAAVAVLGDGYWHRQFGGSASVLGRVVHIGQGTYTVVGVAPVGFRGTESDQPDVYLPIDIAGASDMPMLWFAGRSSTWLSLIARLAPGASAEVGGEQATGIERAGNAYPGMDTTGYIVAASIIPGRGPDAPRAARIALWLGALSMLVLLIACANVASLLMGRAFARQHETAVRLSLGASRSRLAKQYLAEGVLLAVVGAAAAAWMSGAASRFLTHMFTAVPADGNNSDARILTFTAIVGIGTGVLVSLAPMLQTVVPDLMGGLRPGPGSHGGRRSRAREFLLAEQAALCLILLVGAGVFATSMHEVDALDIGMDASHSTMVRFDLAHVGLSQPAIAAALSRIAANVRTLPDVEHVAFAVGDPYRGGIAVDAHTARGETAAMREAWRAYGTASEEDAVGSGFFRTIGATSLRGRDFNSSDRAGSPRVAILTAPLAKLLWPSEDALGKCVLLGHWQDSQSSECVTVVGIVDGYWRRDILDRHVFTVYVPIEQSRTLPYTPSILFVRTRTPPATLVGAIRSAVQKAEPALRTVRVQPMSQILASQYRPWQLGAAMFALFGVVALAIAVVGLYAVVAFNTIQRSSEFAIRMALGARRRDVLIAVTGEGLRAVGIGMAAGTALVLAIHHWIDPLLFHVSASDPSILLGSCSALLLVSLAASLIPAVRVLRQSPAEILHSEL